VVPDLCSDLSLISKGLGLSLNPWPQTEPQSLVRGLFLITGHGLFHESWSHTAIYKMLLWWGREQRDDCSWLCSEKFHPSPQAWAAAKPGLHTAGLSSKQVQSHRGRSAHATQSSCCVCLQSHHLAHDAMVIALSEPGALLKIF
jgi:hypothetical protein